MNQRSLLTILLVFGSAIGCTNNADFKETSKPPVLNSFDKSSAHRIKSYPYNKYHANRRKDYKEYWEKAAPATPAQKTSSTQSGERAEQSQ